MRSLIIFALITVFLTACRANADTKPTPKPQPLVIRPGYALQTGKLNPQPQLATLPCGKPVKVGGYFSLFLTEEKEPYVIGAIYIQQIIGDQFRIAIYGSPGFGDTVTQGEYLGIFERSSGKLLPLLRFTQVDEKTGVQAVPIVGQETICTSGS